MCYRLLRGTLCIPILLLMILGCGDGDEGITREIVARPVEEPPNYYPNTIGSRWVYRSPDGVEWAREVTETAEIGLHLYHVFNYDPPIEDTRFNFLKTPSYRITRNRVLFFVGDEIDRAYKEDLTDFLRESYQEFGDIKINVNAVSQEELVFFRIPPARGIQWEVINMKASGNVVFRDQGNFILPFEINWANSGIVTALDSVETPAGTFDDCFKIQYDSRVTAIVNHEEEELLRTEVQNIWLAPEVGVVKIEDEDGTTELIEYTIAE